MAKSISRYLADISSTSGVLDGTLSTAAQTNITSLGTLSSLTVSGAMNGTLSTAAQPNITSVGTLSNLVIANGGNIGSASDTDAISISSGGVVTMNQIPVLSAGLNVSGGTIAGTLSTAAQPNITSVGTLTTLTIDDITINGSTISDAANFEIDSGGNIILDADGGSLFLKDGGTEFGLLQKFSNNFNIKSSISDGDLVLQGNDGGSAINALILDMSDAGSAHFNSRVGIGVAAHATAGLNITADGSNQNIRLNNGSELGIIDLDSDGNLTIWAHGDENIRFFNGTGTGTELMRIQNTGITQFFTGDGQSGIAEFRTNASSGSVSGYISFAPQGTTRAFVGTGSSLLSGADVSDFILRSEGSLILNSSGNNERLRVRSDGNVGIGSIGMPSNTSYRQLSIGPMAHIMAEHTSGTGRSFHISQNAHLDTDSSWETMETDEASNYYQHAGQHVFRTAGVTNAGTDITWTTSMQITQSRIRTPHINIGNLSSSSYDYQGSSPAAGFQIFSFTCTADNTFRTVLSGFNNTAFEFTTAVGDAASKDNASYSGVLTSPAYGVSAMNQNYYHNNGWNTGSFAYQFVNNGTADYYLQVKMTSYYSSSNTATGYIFLRRLY